MKRKPVIALFAAALLALGAPPTLAQSQLRTVGKASQIFVAGKPMLLLAGELGNSSASSVADIERIFPKLQRMGLNTVLVPAYWDLTEPVEGQFDFTLTDAVIQNARKNNLKVVFLWFGAWKNSMSCYAPLWFKADCKKYPRVHTAAGKPLEIASPFSENVFAADSRAFTKWLQHLAKADTDQTVVMIQIENEIGMLESARDYSADANKLYNSDVPKPLIDYLVKNKKTLHPEMLGKWGAQSYTTKGTWADVFGNDIFTEEIFMAYHYALYVERMAQIARANYNVPLYVNAALNSRGRKPGQYPSAGPLAHLIDIWRCGAPTIDFISPDIYDTGFASWTAKYDLPGNPLFIPEMRIGEDNGVQAFYVFGQHEALGVSPFSIENGKEDGKLSKAYAKLDELAPLLAKHRVTDATHGLLFDGTNKETVINRDGMKITARHFFTLPWDPRATDGSAWPAGGGLLLRLADDEYIVAGSGIVVEFEKETETNVRRSLGEDGFANSGAQDTAQPQTWSGCARVGIGFVDEVAVEPDGSLKYIRRLNGDEDHQGRHVRIGVDDFSILHVKLYEYK